MIYSKLYNKAVNPHQFAEFASAVERRRRTASPANERLVIHSDGSVEAGMTASDANITIAVDLRLWPAGDARIRMDASPGIPAEKLAAKADELMSRLFGVSGR